MPGFQSAVFSCDLKSFQIGSMTAPCPAPLELREWCAPSMALHRHLRTDSCTALTTTAGGSRSSLNLLPSSIKIFTGSSTVHFRRDAVHINAAAGPYTTLHGCVALASLTFPSATSCRRCLMGSQRFHTAWAQWPMGPAWASKAGSTLPVVDPSASIRAKSKLWPDTPQEGAAAAATALRCFSSVLDDVPVVTCPNVSAATPPVRSTLDVSTRALLNNRYLPLFCRKRFSRVFITIALRRTPEPSAEPSDLFFILNCTPCRVSWSPNSCPSLTFDAVHTDFVADTSMPSARILSHTMRTNPTRWCLMCLSGATDSAERSSTNNVGVTDG